MSGNLEHFGAYKKALELFDLVVVDVNQFLGDRKLEHRVALADEVNRILSATIAKLTRQ